MTNKRKTIAVYTPFLGGFYLGELSAHIRQQAEIRGFNLNIVMTSGFGTFDLDLSTDHIDAAIVVLNCVSARLVQKLLSREIPVVSTVEYFFPLEVEAVVSDQNSGIAQLYDHLYALGHRRIGFAGDISVVDMRLRYEALQACYTQKGLCFDSNDFFNVDEFTLPGGRIAGQQFLDRGKQCSAVICACDLNAMGFAEQVKKAGLTLPDDIAIVGVDNTALGKSFTPKLTSVDQELGPLVQGLFDRVALRLSGGGFNSDVVKIPQTLWVRESCGSHSLPNATPEPVHIQDEQPIVQNQNESVMALAKSGFDSILNMSCLWGPFLEWGCLGLWHDDKEDSIRLTNIFSESHLANDLQANDGVTVPSHAFPPSYLDNLPFPEHYVITHIPILAEGRCWGVLLIVDTFRRDVGQSLYSMFNNYMDLVSFFMQREALVSTVREREQNAKELAERLEVVANTSNDGIWSWDLDSNVVEWNNRLLEMLGFTTAQDIKIYRNMSFFERIHPQDQGYIRQLFKSHLEDYQPFKAKFRIQAQNRSFIWVDASGEAIREPGGRVGRFVGSMTDITEQRLSEKKIKHLAYFDSLTGLPNRVSVTESLANHIKDSANQSLAVMLLDLNRFKVVNDSYGHQTGDALLVHVAKRVKKALRRSDIFARFGGDEFILLSRVTDTTEAEAVAERILEHLNGVFKDDNGVEISVKGSLGISIYPDHSTSSEELLKKADVAMYKAKNAMLDRAIMYSEGMDVDLKEMLAKESHLRRAIEKNEMYLVFQPQINTHSELIIGAEVLARWHSKKFGFVSPGIFIPLAEDTGFINTLGEWVLDESLKVLHRWQQSHGSDFKLSINVSAGQLYDPGFADRVSEKVDKLGIKPNTLTLEITESAAIGDIEQSRKELKKLTNKGIDVSLDDFGTGYSSLSLLNTLPLQWVKIDKSFINRLEDEDAQKGMVKSITEMCHSLGYHVVAEGVETIEQLQLVREIGCDVIQGFYFEKPIPLADFESKYLLVK